jgi:hypothetical protein
MFLDSSGWILNGHVPPAEINHTPTHPAMHGVERSLFESERRQNVSPAISPGEIIEDFRT